MIGVPYNKSNDAEISAYNIRYNIIQQIATKQQEDWISADFLGSFCSVERDAS